MQIPLPLQYLSSNFSLHSWLIVPCKQIKHGKMEAQRGEVTCPSPHNYYGEAELDMFFITALAFPPNYSLRTILVASLHDSRGHQWSLQKLKNDWIFRVKFFLPRGLSDHGAKFP